ncbi:hypothetical protein LINPERPRIM_LOCUS8969 [Linum perenne]
MPQRRKAQLSLLCFSRVAEGFHQMEGRERLTDFWVRVRLSVWN